MLQYVCPGLILTTLFALGFGGSVFAGPMEDGQDAYNREDYAKALELWQPLAEQGVARAQNNLGVMYENGKGVPEDINEALKWYRLSAEQGYAGAQNNLGLIYALGKGIPQDTLRAYMWLNLAASALSGDVGKTVAESRDVVAGMMKPQQLADATEMAQKCQAANYKQCESSDAEAARSATGLSTAPPGATFAIATTSHDVTADDYPRESVRLHETGTVTVTYVVSETGSVASCTVVLTSGITRLDNAACTMVKKRWKYKPATQDGKAVDIQYISKVVFPPR
jgi:hypothetical protein